MHLLWPDLSYINTSDSFNNCPASGLFILHQPLMMGSSLPAIQSISISKMTFIVCFLEPLLILNWVIWQQKLRYWLGGVAWGRPFRKNNFKEERKEESGGRRSWFSWVWELRCLSGCPKLSWAFVSLPQHIVGCGMSSGSWGNFGQGDFGDWEQGQ